MTGFRFRLTTLLRLRESARDERRAQLAEALAAELKLLARRDQLAIEIHESEQAQRASLGEVDIDRLMARHRYELVLKAEAFTIREQHAVVEAEIEKRRGALVAADREVKILEMLREKQSDRHDRAQAAADAKELDEVAGRNWQRRDD